MKLVLASASPRRRHLFSLLNLDFEVRPSDVKEPEDSDLPPAGFAGFLSALKARDVASGLTDCLVVGADTIVILDEKILGKPKNPQDAISMLESLSGRTHEVITGVTLIHVGLEGIELEKTFHVSTKVAFSPLDRDEIEAYVKGGSPMDKAGAYGIQDDYGAFFVESIQGDYYNVVGFPLNRFYQEIKMLFPGYFRQAHIPTKHL